MINSENNKKLELEIEKIIQEKNFLWKESFENWKKYQKAGKILSPIAIFLLLFIIPVFNIFKIQSLFDLCIGLAVLFFLLWFWYKIFSALFLKNNLISPWIVGLIEKAKELSAGNLENAKKVGNLLMGSFFIFFGLMLAIVNPEDKIAEGISLGFGVMFIFLGFLGIIHYVIAKKPERVLFFLKNNKIINFLFFLIISIFCIFVLKSIFLMLMR